MTEVQEFDDDAFGRTAGSLLRHCCLLGTVTGDWSSVMVEVSSVGTLDDVEVGSVEMGFLLFAKVRLLMLIKKIY